MINPTTPEFSNDRPLSNKADDKLNRAAFADRVAGVLRGLPTGTGLVVGIHGPWGDGKTTVLNMLRADLRQDGKVVVRDFNPWRLSDEESMLRGFFRMLAEAINKSLATRVEETKAAAAKWTKPFRWITKPLGWLWKPAETADDMLAKIGEIAASGDTVALDELRGRINKHLKASVKRIVVLVDDIDRLDKHETHTLFRLIKACADFPNVCYVLAFDDVAVAKSLGERYGAGDEASGRAFLEKIIQVPLKLPVAMREDLRELCLHQVDQALTAAGVELTREEIGKFISGFERGIASRLDTPRAAKRYGNALMFALPMLKGEVNMVDLLLVEAGRAFYPGVYDCIRADHAEFSGVEPEHHGRDKDGVRGVALLKPIIEAMPAKEQSAVKSLLKDLFPRVGSEYGGSNYGSSWLTQWAQDKRLCSPDYCPRYFTYAVNKSDVRDSEMDAVYAKAASGTEAELLGILEAFFTGGKASRVIERMRQREKDIDPKTAAALCVAVASLAKHIPNPPSLFSFEGPPAQAGILVSFLIKRLPAGAPRVDLAERVIAAADPLWFGDECLGWLHVTDDADKADHNTMTKEEVKEVRKALVERIKARAAAGEPLFSIDVHQEQSLLFQWWRVEGREPIQRHLAALFEKDPKNITLFLQAMAPRTRGLNDLLPRVGSLDGDELKNIKRHFDLDVLASLIQKHLPGDYANPQWFPDRTKTVEQRLAEQFMFVYNKWKKDGEPPDATSGTSSVLPGTDSDDEKNSADEVE